MSADEAHYLTRILKSIELGESGAQERLWSFIYDELHRLANSQLSGEAAKVTLQPTALVNEAYIRLFGREGASFANRRHFFAAAAEAMRRIRIDYARKRGSLKRGHRAEALRLDDAPESLMRKLGRWDQDPTMLLAINEALNRLEDADPRRAEIVKLRFFAGFSIEEVANAVGVAPRTIDYEWRFARAWLHRELTKGDTTNG